MNNIQYHDTIESLPYADYQPSHQEMQIMDTLFKPENKAVVNNVLDEFKEYAFIAILFALFSSPFTDKYIVKYLPISNPYFILIIKTFAFIIFTWAIQNKNLFFN